MSSIESSGKFPMSIPICLKNLDPEGGVIPIKGPVRLGKWFETNKFICPAKLSTEEALRLLGETLENGVIQKATAAHGWINLALRRLKKLAKEDPNNPALSLKQWLEEAAKDTTGAKDYTEASAKICRNPGKPVPIKNPYGSKKQESVFNPDGLFEDVGCLLGAA